MKRGHKVSRRGQASIVAANLASIGALKMARRLAHKAGCLQVDVFGGSRCRSATRVRHQIWTILRHTLGLSYPEIGRLWASFDHTSIMAGVKRRERELDEDYRRGLLEIRQQPLFQPKDSPTPWRP